MEEMPYGQEDAAGKRAVVVRDDLIGFYISDRPQSLESQLDPQTALGCQ
jgi:hypothetical protein